MEGRGGGGKESRGATYVEGPSSKWGRVCRRHSYVREVKQIFETKRYRRNRLNEKNRRKKKKKKRKREGKDEK